jgi:hypothetical protein
MHSVDKEQVNYMAPEVDCKIYDTKADNLGVILQ